MRPFHELLDESVALHGHMCPGQVLGVRLAMLGCREVGVLDPKLTRNLIVYVEIDRCATDAIQSVTGCKLGKRTLKYMDYGKMAATFFNTETGRAVRVVARDDARERAWAYGYKGAGKKDVQLLAYRQMPDEELFVATPVHLQVPDEDLPGHPLSRVICSNCGEGVNDRREIEQGGRMLCRACALRAYYQVVASVSQTKASPTTVESTPPLQNGLGPRPVIAIVGPSDSGKTRVATELVQILTAWGYRIVAVKHCPHGHQVDRSATDSARLFEAGAGLVIASSPDKITYIERTGANISLEQIAATIGPGYDLVMAEGFKGSTVPKVLVLGKEEISPTPKKVIAIVSDHRTEASPVPCYSFQQLSELAEQIQCQILDQASSFVG